MKTILLFLLFLITGNLFAQDEQFSEIVISDSLFYLPSNYYRGSFGISEGGFLHGEKLDNIEDINDFFVYKNGYLTIKVNYGCGCGKTDFKLITDGYLVNDKDKRYYLVRIWFDSNDYCSALCHRRLNFDISKLSNEKEPIYLKYVGSDQMIICK